MKRSLWLGAVVLGVIVGQPVLLRGQTISPVGTWQVSVVGSEEGTLMMTFSTNSTVTGYGVTRKQFGFITLAGSWNYDSKGDVVAAYVETANDVGSAFNLTARMLSSGRFLGHARGAGGGYQCKGEQPDGLPDLSGSWNAEIKRKGKAYIEQFTATSSTNYPHVYDIAGQGLSEAGSYTLSGAIIASSRDKVSAAVARTFGADTQTSAVSGNLKHGRSAMSMSGSDDTGAHLTESVDR
jgi:hypothetical protein